MRSCPLLPVCCLLLLAGLSAAQSFNTKFPSGKTWWAKYVLEDVRTAGRLSDFQIKHASEAGYKSIISLVNFTSPGEYGGEYLPNTDEASRIARDLAGLEFAVLTQQDDGLAWAELSTVQAFTQAYYTMPKPILFYCSSAYRASFILLLHMANMTRHNSSYEPQVDAHEFYKRANGLGYDYSKTDKLRQLLAEVTGEDIQNPPKPDVSIPDWNNHLWWIKPLYKNWFVAGQFHAGHIQRLDSTPMTTLLNVRRPVLNPETGEKTQEEVNLLNIKTGTGTYTGTGRQSEAELLKNRIWPNKTNTYISENSSVNYQSRYPQEFGDDIGYNETLERLAAESTSLHYMNSPLSFYGYNTDMYERFKEDWSTAGKKGAVLSQCRIGYRASVAALLGAGEQYGLDYKWALDRAHSMGYFFSEEEDPDVIKLIKDVLGPTSGASSNVHSSSLMVFVTAAIYAVYASLC